MPRRKVKQADPGRQKVVAGLKNRRSTAALAIEATQARCPEGHPLPHKTQNGSCTPVYCAAATQDTVKFSTIGKHGQKTRAEKNKVMALLSEEADKVIDNLIPETVPGFREARAAAKAQKGEELMRLAEGIGRYSAMKTYFAIPEGLSGADAESWIQKRSLELSVDALAEFERQLKLGDDNQRREAARDILKMNGMDKKEAPPQANAVIILNNPAGLAGLPWLRQTQVIEAPAPKEIAADAKKHS